MVLGDSCYRIGQYGRAFALFKAHKKIAEEMGDRAAVGVACGNLGNCYESMGQYGRAMALHEERKKIAEEGFGDREGVGRECEVDEVEIVMAIWEVNRFIAASENDRAMAVWRVATSPKP